jgi:GT2 family glycosyltransferase
METPSHRFSGETLLDSQYPSVSIIVPYFGNCHYQLRHCLWCLEHQSYPPTQREIVVVDNNPTARITEDLLGRDRISIVHEPVPGSYAARNRGIASSTGSMLAFTDVDCAPTPTWLNNAIQELARFDFNAVVGGKIVFGYRDPANPNIWETYDSIIHLRQRDYIVHDRFAATANLIAPRKLFLRTGFFNPAFYSGGDRDWGMRLSSQGIPVIYSADAVVFHRARHDAREIIEKNRRGVGAELIRVQISKTFRGQILRAQIQMFIPRFQILIEETKIRTYGYWTQLRLSMIFVLICIVRCYEAIRLIFGGQPLR